MRPYTVVNDEHLLAGIAREIESADVIGLDLETAKIGGGGSFDPLTGRPRLFSVNTGQGLYLIGLYKTKTLGPVLDAFRRTKGVTVGQNMKFDQKWLLWHFDLEIGKLFDTLRASSIIYAGLPGLKHDLWSLYKRELGEAATVEDLGGSDWDGTLTQRQLDYAADDIDKLPRLRDVLKPKIVQAGLVKIAQLEFNAVLPEACMELNGFFLDKGMWLTRTASDRVQLERLRASLLSKLPNPSNQLGLFGPSPFNLDSPDQILKSLCMMGVKQKWKDPETGLTKTVPLMDTKEMTLAMEADRWPILKEFIEYRGYAQAVKSFGEEYLKHIHATTGRIHSSYFPFTDTGRYANRGPNLQQVPRGGAFRDCFRAAEGRSLAICDWSNIEMRIVAEVSKDPVLIKVFQDDRDAHYATASLVTGKPESEIVKAERQQAKPVNFGFCIAEGQRVLTQAGLIPIESVRDWHVVWDGIEWVTHDGLIDRGMQPVQTYDGLTATPDHEVFTDDGHRISMREAASPLRPRRLAVGAIGLDPVGYTAFDRQGRTAASQPEVRRGHLRPLHPNPLDSGRQHTGAEDDQLHLPREVQRSPIRDLGRALRLYGAALSSGYARLVAQLQGTRDSGLVPVEGAVHSLGSGELPGLQLQGAGLRPNGQQRALRAIEPSAGDALGKLEEPLPLARVYDLLNAGPRHRFTVEGKVVSNCYGMQAARMVLYAKQGYGVNMTEATARTFRRKFFEAYEGIASWHRGALDSGKRRKETRTVWGRRRILKDEKAHNEFYNSPIQGTGADGLKVGIRNVYDRLKKLAGRTPLLGKGAKCAPVHMVHDEIVCEHDEDPELEIHVRQELHDGMIEGIAPMLPSVPTRAEVGGGKSWASKS